jgi:Bacterial regulatory protein, Fis family
MSTMVKPIRQPLGTILPLSEVKRRVIVDALDKCGGNYLLAAHLLGIGRTTIYRMGRMYRYQQPRIQAEQLMSMSQCKSSFDAREPKGEPMRTNDTMNVGE